MHAVENAKHYIQVVDGDGVRDESRGTQDELLAPQQAKTTESAIPEGFGDEFGHHFLAKQLQVTHPRTKPSRIVTPDNNAAVVHIVHVEREVGEVEHADRIGALVSNGGEQPAGQLETAQVVIS